MNGSDRQCMHSQEKWNQLLILTVWSKKNHLVGPSQANATVHLITREI